MTSCGACVSRNEGCIDGCVESARVCNTIFDGHPNRFAICNGIRRGCDQKCTDAQDYNGVIQRCQRALCGREVTTMGTEDPPLWANRLQAVSNSRTALRTNRIQTPRYKTARYGVAQQAQPWVPRGVPLARQFTRSFQNTLQNKYADRNCGSNWPLRNYEEPEGDCPTWCLDSEQELTKPARRFPYGYNYAHITRPGISAANNYMPGLYDEQGLGCYRKQWAQNNETCQYFD
jgi:hypothetical protein